MLAIVATTAAVGIVVHEWLGVAVWGRLTHFQRHQTGETSSASFLRVAAPYSSQISSTALRKASLSLCLEPLGRPRGLRTPPGGRRPDEFDEECALSTADDASRIDVSEGMEFEDIRDAETGA